MTSRHPRHPSATPQSVLTRRKLLLATATLAAASALEPPAGMGASVADAQPVSIPNMPAKNPFLADSVFPITHFNPAVTDAVAHAGPTSGRALGDADVMTVATLYTSSGTVKTIGGATIIVASGIDGIRKINATEKSFDLVSLLPYPGLEALPERTTPAALAALLAEADAAVAARDEAKIIALSKRLADRGLSRRYKRNGALSLIDNEGFHYAGFGGVKIVKTTDDNDPGKPLRVAKVIDLAEELPPDLASRASALSAFNMTYDGDIVAAAHGALFLLDRNLNVKGILGFPGEAIENSVAVDETGIYVVTSERMLKIVWTGSRLSFDETDGGWQSEYNTMSREQATALGSPTQSGGSGTPPALMGFGDDGDKLVVIADADPAGTNVVAFWRDKIPSGFRQKPGTKSARIADQTRIDISRVTIEAPPNVLGNGVLVVNRSYPKPAADLWTDAMLSGVTRPAPTGAQKFTWNTQTKALDKAWVAKEVDNTDQVVPVVSAATGLVYFASKQQGRYECVALDWMNGEVRARWPFPDDSRKWNACGGSNVLLADGDFLLGGLFALKRVRAGNGSAPAALGRALR
jgi:hypothetical protein